MIINSNLINNLKIQKILMIDDELTELEGDKKFQMALSVISRFNTDPKLYNKLTQLLDERIVNDILNYEDFNILYENEDIRDTVINAVCEFKADAFYGSAYPIYQKIATAFQGIQVDVLTDPLRPEKKKLADYDLIFMDYEYSTDTTALEIIHKLKLNRDSLNYIIFLSGKDTFTYHNENYNMTGPEFKQDLLRKIRSDNFSKFSALINYLNKEKTTEDIIFIYEMNQILEEFNSGKIMTESIESLGRLLIDGVNDAQKQLMLTNTKTMKAVITDKLEKEGVSETSFLVDLSVSIVKNLINNNIPQLKDIHQKIENITGWEGAIWDYETDKHIRDLRELQILDKTVNTRFSPVDFGDIFTFSLNGKQVRGLLVAQTCDLIVRWQDDALGRHANVSMFILEETEEIKQKKGIIKYRIGAHKITWNLRRKLLVPTKILDLASLNLDGTCSFKVDQEITRQFSWGSYYTNHMKNCIKDIANAITKKGMNIFWEDGIAWPFRKRKDKIAFPMSRWARLDYLHALEIYKQFLDIESRVPIVKDISDEPLLLKQTKTKFNNRDARINALINEISSPIIYFDFDNLISFLKQETSAEGVFDSLAGELTMDHFIAKQQHGKRLLEIDTKNSILTELLSNYGITITLSRDKSLVSIFFKPDKWKGEEEVAALSE